LVVYPIIYRVLRIPGSEGFLPSIGIVDIYHKFNWTVSHLLYYHGGICSCKFPHKDTWNLDNGDQMEKTPAKKLFQEFSANLGVLKILRDVLHGNLLIVPNPSPSHDKIPKIFRYPNCWESFPSHWPASLTQL